MTRNIYSTRRAPTYPAYAADVLGFLGQLQDYTAIRDFTAQVDLNERRMGFMSLAQFDTIYNLSAAWFGDAQAKIVVIRGAPNTNPIQPINEIEAPNRYADQFKVPPLPGIRTYDEYAHVGGYPGNPVPDPPGKPIIPKPDPIIKPIGPIRPRPRPWPWPPWPVPGPAPDPVNWTPSVESNYSYIVAYWYIAEDMVAKDPMLEEHIYNWQFALRGLFENYFALFGFTSTPEQLKEMCLESGAELRKALYG